MLQTVRGSVIELLVVSKEALTKLATGNIGAFELLRIISLARPVELGLGQGWRTSSSSGRGLCLALSTSRLYLKASGALLGLALILS